MAMWQLRWLPAISYSPIYSYKSPLPPNKSESLEPKRIKHWIILSVKNLRVSRQASVPVVDWYSHVNYLVL